MEKQRWHPAQRYRIGITHHSTGPPSAAGEFKHVRLSEMTAFRLLAVVEVPQADRVVCQAPGCKHPVYKRIHVVQKDGELTVLGSECFKKLFGEAGSTPSFGSGEGRLLTPEERQLLVENTERLISQFEAEHLAALEKARLAAERQAQIAAEKQAAAEATSRAAEQRRQLETERQSSLAIPVPQPAWKPTPIASHKPLPPTNDPRYQTVLLQVKQEYRARGLDPDQAGWVGMVQYEVKERLRKSPLA